ncbi:MAG: SrfA family protein, partial [Zoogloeaceae bacterium]|nr:SrfA family protein [Zoogloeaceae bacterium]
MSTDGDGLRKKMPGVLLRSGTLQEFRVLGVDGQPAYRSALQLREAIRLKIGREAANCLAIPQPSESGDRIDWYAPREGEVVPWSAATEEERASALDQLERLHSDLLSTADSMREDTQNREKQLFARLLKMTRNFPDDGHVYLVDGKPVVTFWGFTDRAGANEHDPLLCLRPPRLSPAPVAPLAAPMPAPSAIPVVTGSSQRPGGSRWWRWLWLLLLPLLLLPLLSLLRSCAPQLGLPQIGLPGLPKLDLSANGRAGEGMGTPELPSAGSVPDGAPSAQALPQAQEPDRQQSPDLGIPPLELDGKPEVPVQPDAPVSEPPPSQIPPPELSPEPGGKPEAPVQPDAPLGESPHNQIPPPELGIPPQALKNGSVDFLNGRWKAGAGIQDAQTGKPLRLDYEFQNGQGQVRVRRGDGIECSGPVAAE